MLLSSSTVKMVSLVREKAVATPAVLILKVRMTCFVAMSQSSTLPVSPMTEYIDEDLSPGLSDGEGPTVRPKNRLWHCAVTGRMTDGVPVWTSRLHILQHLLFMRIWSPAGEKEAPMMGNFLKK
mmetsp:Transcript_107550/g.231586  ORF Transcript_107550/g.231586 Transcript_107550/m.231586 type:complete len:124 (+) Transcript_107550:79-450(+)